MKLGNKRKSFFLFNLYLKDAGFNSMNCDFLKIEHKHQIEIPHFGSSNISVIVEIQKQRFPSFKICWLLPSDVLFFFKLFCFLVFLVSSHYISIIFIRKTTCVEGKQPRKDFLKLCGPRIYFLKLFLWYQLTFQMKMKSLFFFFLTKE